MPPTDSSLVAAIGWIEALLARRLATAVAILAIALIGFRMLLGQVSVRRAAGVILGCFIVFGAPLIARGLIGAIERASPAASTLDPMGYGSGPLLGPAPTAPPARGGNPFDPAAADPR